MTQAAGNARTQRAVQPPHRVSARRVPLVAPPARWAQTLRRFGRYAVWAVPVYAVLAGIVALRHDPSFDTDVKAYEAYLDRDRFTVGHISAVVGLAFFGLVALVGVTALLAGVRGRRLAGTGLVLGLAGAALLLPEVGTLVVRQEAARNALLHGDFSAVVLNAQVRGGGAVAAVLIGALVLTAAWILVGVAVWRSRVMQRTDGVLLMISSPLLYLGGFLLRMLPVLGALLLLAAGMGLAFTATRLTPADPPRG
jgi:hypothetical protein